PTVIGVPTCSLPIGDPAAGQPQPGEDQDVRAGDPFQAGPSQVQVPLGRRGRHVDHVVVEIRHERAERYRDERPPAPILLHHSPLYAVTVRRPCTLYMYFVHETCTLYGCQVATEKLSRSAVAERALRLGDEEGLEAVTIR